MHPSVENYISKRANRLERYIGDEYAGHITTVIIEGIIATHIECIYDIIFIPDIRGFL